MKLTNANVIRSVSDDQHQILKWIIELYVPEGRFDLDPTYSKGVFYKTDVPEPRFKGDLFPQNDSTIPMNMVDLPFKKSTLNSVIVDPPFATGKSSYGIIKERFSEFKTMPDLWNAYYLMLMESKRVLREGGVLVLKCQDGVSSGLQWLTHVAMITVANRLDFYVKDLFILTANKRVINPHQKQQHARKFHSYFLVFIKEKPKVKYP